MKNLTEMDKLKYWLDTEFTVLHIMFALIMMQLVNNWLVSLFFSIYIVIQVLYMIPRLALLASADKDFLKVPKK